MGHILEESRFARDAPAGRAIHMPLVLALALIGRGPENAATHRALIARLRAMAGFRLATL